MFSADLRYYRSNATPHYRALASRAPWRLRFAELLALKVQSVALSVCARVEASREEFYRRECPKLGHCEPCRRGGTAPTCCACGAELR